MIDQTAGRAKIVLSVDHAKLGTGLEKAQGRLRQFAQSVDSMASKLSIIGAVAQYPIRSAINIFAGFDDQMRMVAAITGTTGEEFASLTDLARLLGRTTQATARDVAAGMTELARTGFTAQEIKDAISPVMNLTFATGTGLAEAAVIAANNLRVFGLDASKMSDVVDILTVVTNRSSTTLTDLGEALKMSGPHAARFGETLLDTSASLGVLANMGIKGSMAGTALARSFQQMVTPEVQNLLGGMGISVADANGNLRKMHSILADIAVVLSTMGTSDAGLLMSKIFDVRGSLGGGVVAANPEKIKQMLTELKGYGGEAARIAGEMEAGTGGAIRRLTSALEGFQIAMGNVLSRAFSPVIEGATELLNRLEPLTEEFKGVIGPVVKTASAILALGLAAKGAGVAVWTIKALASPFALLSRMASGLATSVAAARVQLMATARPITLLTIASRGAVATGTAHIAMNRALGVSLNGVAVAARTAGTAIGTFIKANWIGLLVAGLVALYSWYQSKLAKVQAEIERTSDAMKQAADVAKKALDTRYDENKGAWEKFGSLQQLEKLSTMRDLTEDEIKQVNALKAELAGFGSGAFAFVDDGAKSFRLAADATERMTVAMRENATRGLEAQKAAVLKQIAMIEKRAQAEIDAKEAPMSVGMALQGRGTMDTWKQRGVKDALVWERGEYALLQASLMRVNKQLDEMKNAPVVDTIGGVFGEDAAARVAMTAEQIAELEKKTKAAVEEMEKLFTEAQRQGMTPVQREIEEVGDLEKKYRDAEKVKRDFLLAAGRAAFARGDAGEVSRMVDEVKALDAQQARFRAMLDARRAAITTEGVKGYDTFLDTSSRDYAAKRAEEAGDRAFDKMVERGAFRNLDAFMGALRGGISGMRSEYARLYASATSPTGEAGALLSQDEQTALDAMKERISKAMGKFGEYSTQLAEARAGANAASERVTRGAYNIDKFFAKSGMGGKSDAKRTADATEDSRKLLADLYNWLTDNNTPLVIGG